MTVHNYPAKFRYQGEVAERFLDRRIRSPMWQQEQLIVGGLIDQFAPSSVVLDVPAGTGRFLEFYTRENHTAYGIDISRDMLIEATKLQAEADAFEVLIQGDAECLPLADGSVDYVVCNRLMNWVPLPVFAGLISEFKRVARRRIVVGVRVIETLGAPALIRKGCIEVVSNPRVALSHTALRLINKLNAGLVIAKRRAFPNHSNIEQHSIHNHQGYFLHGVHEVSRIFDEQNLAVVSVNLVDERTNFARRELRSLLMYLLQVEDSMGPVIGLQARPDQGVC